MADNRAGPRRILHIIHGLTVGGAEVDLINKSTALARDYGYKITICCLMRRGALANQAESAGVSVIGPLMRHRYDVTAGFRLRRLLLAGGWSVVHTHLFAGNFVATTVMMTIPANKRPALLAADHAMAYRWGRIPLLIDRIVQRQVAYILVPSQAAASSFEARGLNRQRFRVVSNAIDTARFTAVDRAAARAQIEQELNIAPAAYLVGTVCRLQPVKALPVLIEAVKSLPVHLVIAGDGPEYSHLASIISEYALEDRVQLLGSRSDVPQLLAALDLFVLPSRSESFGIAVAEALLAKTPVVATRVGGIPEITGGEKYGQLVPPHDVTALAAAIRWAIDHPVTAKKQAEAGCNFVQNSISIDAVAGQQDSIYREIVGVKPGEK